MTAQDLPTRQLSTRQLSEQHVPERVSDADRDHVIDVLREGAAQGRLSPDTFQYRMELALVAHSYDQLAELTADLPRGSRLAKAILGTVARASSFGVRVRMAWQTEKLPPLMLPAPGLSPLRIGRDPVNGLRVMEKTVSRVHAEFRCQGGVWLLRDLGSTNGTFVNGRRLTGAAVVSSGDQIGFGQASYRLTAR